MIFFSTSSSVVYDITILVVLDLSYVCEHGLFIDIFLGEEMRI